MANTIDPALVSQALSAKTHTLVKKALVALKVFSTNYSASKIKPKGTLDVPMATAASGAIVNGTTFTGGDTTVEDVPVVMNNITQLFHLTYDELNGTEAGLDTILDVNLISFTDKIMEQVFKAITTAKFGDSAVVADPDTFDAKDLQKIWAELKGKRKHIILASELYANFNAVDADSLTGDSRFGFQKFLHTDTVVGLPTKAVAVACDPLALCVASRLPIMPNQDQLITYQTFAIPELGITYAFSLFSDNRTRSLQGAFDVCIGVGQSKQANALKIVKTA